MFLARCVYTVVLFLCVTDFANGREWHGRSGNSSVEAEFLDYRDGNVVLKRKDGKVIEVPLDKLSLPDVKYVTDTLKDIGRSIDKPKATSPVPANSSPESSGAATTAGTNSGPKAAAPPPLTDPKSKTWQVKPDVAIDEFVVKPDLAIGAPDAPFSDEVIFPAASSPFVMLYSSRTGLGTVWDVRSGTKKGEARTSVPTSNGTWLSPQGGYTAMAKPLDGEIVIYNNTTGQAGSELTVGDKFTMARFACFPDESHFFAASALENIGFIWEIASGKKIAEFEFKSGNGQRYFAVSKGGAYLAVYTSSDKPLQIFDLRNGRLAGSIDIDPGGTYSAIAGMSFSPDGLELIAVLERSSRPELRLWSLTDGKFIKKFEVARSLQESAPNWFSYSGRTVEFIPNKKGWLLFGRTVFDAEQGKLIWTEKSEPNEDMQIPRLLLPNDQIVAYTGGAKSKMLKAHSLPWDEIAKSSKLVAEGARPEDNDLPPLTTSSFKKTKPIVFAPATESWSLQRESPPAPWGDKIKSTIPMGEKYVNAKGAFFSGQEAATVALATTSESSESGSQNKDMQTITRFDLRTGSRTGQIATKFPTKILDLSPSGKLCVCFTGGKNSRIDVWAFEESRHIVGMRPYEEEKTKQGVAAAAFLDDEHLLTVGETGTIVLWKLPECAPVYVLRDRSFRDLCLDSRRKMMASITANGCYLVDPRNGQCLGTLELPKNVKSRVVSAICFHPDGKQLASLMYDNHERDLLVWDLTSGKLTCDARVPAGGYFLAWASDRHVLFSPPDPSGGSPFRMSLTTTKTLRLFDVQSKRAFWSYEFPFAHHVSNNFDGRFWMMSSPTILDPATLVGITLPTEADVAIIDKLPPLPLLVEKGTAVTLRTKVTGSNEDLASALEEPLRQRVEKLAETQGFVIQDNAPITLDVIVQEKATGEERNYRAFVGGRLSFFSVPIIRIECTIAFRDESGAVFWGRREFVDLGNDLGLERMSPDVSLTQFLQTKQWGRAGEWVKRLDIPGKIYDTRFDIEAGASVLAPDGESNIRSNPLPTEKKKTPAKAKGVRET